MKIIADTNIWYAFSQDKELLNSVKDKNICPTYVNIFELFKTYNLLCNEELVRSSMRSLFEFLDNVIYEPSFIHIAQLHKEYDFDIDDKIGWLLDRTSSFASGAMVDRTNIEQFTQALSHFEQPLKIAAINYNNLAVDVKENIDVHERKEVVPDYNEIFECIDSYVKVATEGAIDLEGFDFDNVELFYKTFWQFLREIEVTSMKIQPNDWLDLLILVYVQPGDKYWTKEKRWKNLIKKAGCGKYLYEDAD